MSLRTRQSSPPSYQTALGNKAGLDSWTPGQLASTIPHVLCPHCNAASPAAAISRGGLDHHDARRGLLGLVARLGKREMIPLTSVVANGSQPMVTDGTFNHPAMILMQSTCGHLVFCAQLTSFSGGGIQHKYAGARNKDALWKYLPISHPAGEAHRPDLQPDELITDRNTSKPSYMNLNGGFWNEWQHLRQFTATEDGQQARLSAKSFRYATWAYNSAELHRLINGDDLQVRLARSQSPPQARPWSRPARRVPPHSAPAVTSTPLSATAAWFAPAAMGGGNMAHPIRTSHSAPAALNPMAAPWA